MRAHGPDALREIGEAAAAPPREPRAARHAAAGHARARVSASDGRARGEADVEPGQRRRARPRRGCRAGSRRSRSRSSPTLAAASSAGVRASCGISAACAGRCAVPRDGEQRGEDQHDAERRARAGGHRAPASATVARTALHSSSARREWRSASIAAYGAASPEGGIRTTAPRRPRSSRPRRRRTAPAGSRTSSLPVQPSPRTARPRSSAGLPSIVRNRDTRGHH